ncbi:MAG TPA: ABC transporter substrate-binding protein [Pseudolabrys sp.]|jgi:NitT/TauT family transport system substrate-binding protein|uniref:ABC transporter substrate-binding protein n=1 Tax=Pseudolabrys sp. TaxID=1960880 RepID=UPI002DDD6C0D|nr:ABC transporter substrate-binding protein [Pseudolabrys sp.]HEV2629957.1 ABC transporter substrate-binding protein [Pseudolabrys sp.]
MLRRTFTMMAGAALVATAFIGAAPASAQGKKIVLAVPGIPPIYSVTIAFVAQKQGFFKKYGADVEIKPFDNGTAAARAVVAGDIDLAWSPTPPVINQVSNAGVPLVAIYGMPNPDWVLGTTEAGKTCKDLAGQEIGVDSINGARSVALRSMLAAGCKDVKIDQVKQVALGSSPGPAMLAGRLHYAVLHLDDLAEIQQQGKKLNILLAMKNTNPTSHYLIMVVRKDNLAKNRDAIVRTVAGMVAAARFMQDPKNADAVAEAASVTGHNKEVNKLALEEFLKINFWAAKDDGMPKNKIEAVAALMKKIGSIKPDKQPVSYDQFVDASVWKDANAMVK